MKDCLLILKGAGGHWAFKKTNVYKLYKENTAGSVSVVNQGAVMLTRSSWSGQGQPIHMSWQATAKNIVSEAISFEEIHVITHEERKLSKQCARCVPFITSAWRSMPDGWRDIPGATRSSCWLWISHGCFTAELKRQSIQWQPKGAMQSCKRSVGMVMLFDSLDHLSASHANTHTWGYHQLRPLKHYIIPFLCHLRRQIP